MTNPTTTTKLVALITVGICDALKEYKIEIADAERLLFSPHVIAKIELWDPQLAEVVHLGTELDDIKHLVPHDYESTIQRIRQLALESLERLQHKNEIELEHWIDSVA